MNLANVLMAHSLVKDSPKSILYVTLVTKNCLEYNITVITKLHSKFELDLNKFSLSLVGPPLRNKGHVDILAPD